jgi:fused signal recognition particle receptor
MGLFSKLIAKVTRTSEVSSADWKDFEAELLASDLGPALVAEVITAAKKVPGDQAVDALTQVLNKSLSSKPRSMNIESGLSTILVVGVNGTGKTTSVAKLAHYYSNQRKIVSLGAADTFRAAAVAQLQTWGARLGISVIAGNDGADPASVAFESATAALANNSEILIIDTAGRLHNKRDLMAELSKVRRVIEKITPINEVLLVIDATTGQNGLAQAKIFSESVHVSGIILTKLDGSARGGVALAIERELDIPIKWIGTGEGEGDFKAFDSASYIDGLIA